MSHWTVIKCDRCGEQVECPPNAVPYQINILGVGYDLCPACLRAHKAFMQGWSLNDCWTKMNEESQKRWLDDMASRRSTAVTSPDDSLPLRD